MLALLTVALTLTNAPQEPIDPEQTRAGRAVYLGRDVAQTMHWTGASWLMRQTREREENGVLLRKWLAVKPGSSICDFGCGNGYHTLPIAKEAGEQGVVFAVDLQPQMLTLLKQRCDAQQIDNVRYVQATIDDPKLPPTSCDQVLLVDVYHELSHPVRVMAHIKRALKPGGRVVLVEFRAEDPDVPIRPEHMMSKAQVIREMAAHGFTLVDEFDELPWQHAMAFSAATSTGQRFSAHEVARSFLRAAGGNDARIVAPYLHPETAPEDLPKVPADARIELLQVAPDAFIAQLQTADRQREVLLLTDPVGRWVVHATDDLAETRRRMARPFVAMHSGLRGLDTSQRVALARGEGFDGVTSTIDQVAEAQADCHQQGCELWATYIVLDVQNVSEARLAQIRAAMQTMAGGPGMLWLGLQNSQQKPRSTSGDQAAIALLAKLLRDADATGIEIALYPHHGFWLETCEDALRLCEAVKHDRLGVCFNLCHFLRAHTEDDPKKILQRCRDHLLAVTINGADTNGQSWPSLIQPLDQGNWDLGRFLTALDEAKFHGPVGLQGYGIEQPPQEHLPASMAAWRAAHEGR